MINRRYSISVFLTLAVVALCWPSFVRPVKAQQDSSVKLTQPKQDIIPIPMPSPKLLLFLETQVEDGDAVGAAFVKNLAFRISQSPSVDLSQSAHELSTPPAFVIRVMTTDACGPDHTIVHVFLLNHRPGERYDLYLGGFTGAISAEHVEGAAAEANTELAHAVAQFMLEQQGFQRQVQ